MSDEVYKLQVEIKRLEKENEQLKAKLKARLTCGFVKAAQMQAIQKFVEKLMTKTHNYYPSIDSYCCSHHVVLVKDIDELLKEYK